MDYLIKIKKGEFWQKERVSGVFLFSRLCELIEKKKDIQVFTVVGQKEYPSLRYKDGVLKFKNFDNEIVMEFKKIKEIKNEQTSRKVW